MEQFKTAVAFATFNRMEKMQQVFEKIREAKPPRLYLISDAARENVPGEVEKVAAVRKYMEEHVDWDCQVFKNYAEKNMSCGRRLSSGISWVFEHEEEAIILEDDCLPDSSFFMYCQEMLEHYRYDERILTIGATNLCPEFQTEKSHVFSIVPHLWGWASWRRAWKLYDFDMKDWPRQKKNPIFHKILPRRAYWFYMAEFDTLYRHAHDTWDYQVMYTSIIHDKLNVTSTQSYIRNIGFDGEATHTVTGDTNELTQISQCKFPISYRKDVVWDREYDTIYLKKTNRHGLIVKIKSILGLDINKSIFEK